MRVIVCAGGTAGHVNPALSLCQRLKAENADNKILFIGTSDRIEADLVPRAGFEYKGIKAQGLSRSLSISGIKHNISALADLISSKKECEKIIRDFKPDAVVGFGGYVTVAVLKAAQKLGVKTAIHEQNAFPGKANITLAKKADEIMLTSPDAAKRMKCAVTPRITGLPVRDEILSADKKTAREKLGIPQDKKVVLITGGSLGARAINDLAVSITEKVSASDNLYLIHGYGSVQKDYPDVLKSRGISPKNAIISEYLYNMADCMAAADLIICRAGASTIAEICAMGKASFLIPYPYATEDHQYYNALYLKENGAAWLSRQEEVSADVLGALVTRLGQGDAEFAQKGENAKKLAHPDAAREIASVVLSMTGKEKTP